MQTTQNTNNKADMMLSPHFSLGEMTRSGTAIKFDIDNTPTEHEVESLRALCNNLLELIRRRFGALPVTSGYRSERVNLLVGGVHDSQHCSGEAADIYVSCQEKAVKMFEYIRKNLVFDQMILEIDEQRSTRWIHISYTTRRVNRCQALTNIRLSSKEKKNQKKQ